MALLGKNKITRADLALVPTPEATDTFRPIPHHQLVETLAETLSFRHINVTEDEYVISDDGMKMFGLLKLDATFLDVRFSIGIRNAHDKSMRLGLVAGYSVMVCSNMAFNGEFKPVLAKHTKHFNLQDALTIGVDRIQRGWEPLQQQMEHRRTLELSDDQARLHIYDAFLAGRFPIKLMKPVDQEYFNPSYEEFKPKTLWSLENAFTSTFKKLKPIPQYQATAQLGQFIKNITPN
jgi:Domain of unknown function (DUF932)